MSTTRLKIYNGALLLVGQRGITSLSATEESRRVLDEVWGDNGVRFCLEQAQWNFAMRSAQFTYDAAITPAFGYSRGFNKPTDWVLTSALCSDEFFRTPNLQYVDENGVWYADIDDIYVRYVSDDSNYGMDFSLWPDSFTEYVKAYFAGRICHKIPGNQEVIHKLHGPPGYPQRGLLHNALLLAKNKAAMTGPTTFPPRGSWSSSRLGGRRGSFDRGNSGSLTG